MNGRIYDPRLGRFLSVDPVFDNLGMTQGVNAYSYVRNNPVSYTDPTGLNTETVKLSPYVVRETPFGLSYASSLSYPKFGTGGISGAPWSASNDRLRNQSFQYASTNSATGEQAGVSGDPATPEGSLRDGRSATSRWVRRGIGFLQATIQDHDPNPFALGPPETGDPDERDGRMVGHAVNLLVGVGEIQLAGTVAVGSGAVAIGSGGTATPVAVAGGVGATVLAADGANAAYNGAKNLIKMNMEGGGLSRGSTPPPRIMPGPVYKTGKEARTAAKAKGWKEVPGMRSHGQDVFTDGKRFFTRDADGHVGGAWKELNRRGERFATLDDSLNVIGK